MSHTIDSVMFRKYPNGDIIAIFPYIQWTDEPAHVICTSYMHVGQHGACDPALVIRGTKRALWVEYEPLLRELEQIGYKLTTITRRRPIRYEQT